MPDISTAFPALGNVIHILLIFILIFSLSPYGVYAAKCFLAWRRGTSMPRIYRKASGQRHVVDHIVDEANRHIHEASERITSLEDDLSKALEALHNCQFENDALRERIREMDRDEQSKGDAARSEVIPDDLLEAFSILWLKAPPVPDWLSVKSAYREAARTHHPDRGGDAETFKQVNNAYDKLKRYYGK